ncbi:MAG: FAD-binding oxidoreductase [Candidatus Parabeggiatoa sp. nov. 1]|nr:MAG: FAD-binding oxidoreductase [Gammaproteobacteria bacterium]
MSNTYQSWGNFPKVSQRTCPIQWRKKPIPLPDVTDTVLPHGLGRSYGDVCLNDGGVLLTTRSLNRFISFDADNGVLCCEAGVSLAEILELCVPQGWFLPTTPGTKFVTVGGAIANDVHGKNHHGAGTFGRHLLQFELLRSDGERLLCSPTSNEQYYGATIGGLGLTGLITWAEIKLKRIYHRAMQAESIQFSDLDEFFELSAQSDQYYDYTVAWVDCSSQGSALGRGIFFRGNHVPQDEIPEKWHLPFIERLPPVLRTMPINLPGFVLNRWSVSAFNWFFYKKQRRKNVSTLVDYDPFFYPLDAIFEWRRLYGKSGFLQYQFVVPFDDHRVIKDILQTIAASKLSSFLVVLKTFGELASPGLLSFPRKGVTLALDFPIKGAITFELLERLDDMVCEAGGVVYPCKDARLSARHFQAYYPQWTEFAQYIDPRFSSSFWRRVTSDQ